MKIYVYPADETGCGLHRLIWPAEQLKRDGHDITIVLPKDRNAAFSGMLNTDGNLTDVRVPEDAEVIVLQRITHRHIVQAIRLLRKRGVAVVVDMDDDLSTIHPSNPAFAAMHPKFGANKDHSWRHAQAACEAATLVTVSTNALLRRYAAHGRGRILYNCVPERYLVMPRVDSTVVGWAGSTHSHPDDLQAMGTAIAQLERITGTPFHVVGDGIGVRSALHLDYDPVTVGPQDPLVGWPGEIAKLGIGVAPLADTLFNAGKSWLKPLEFAALGVPCVVSPSPEYLRLHRLGVGRVARKSRQWLTLLRQLIESQNTRDELSLAGREVACNWTVEGNAWRWGEAWSDAFHVETDTVLSGNAIV